MKFETIHPKYEAYLRDESRMSGDAKGIAFPQSTAQLAKAMQAAREKGESITLQGARTGLNGGAVPTDGYVINCEKLNKLLSFREEKGLFYLRVGAGVTFAQIDTFLNNPAAPPEWNAAANAALALFQKEDTHWFPPAPTEPTATIGGAFSLNAGGIHSMRFGRIGTAVTALTWVTPGADVWEFTRGQHRFTATGCRLPQGKRFSVPGLKGLDLIDFVAGSEGILGAAAELELCLSPLPPEAWGVVFFFDTERDAMRFAGLLLEWRQQDRDCALYAAEYFDAATLTLLRDERKPGTQLRKLPSIPAKAGTALYLELCGQQSDALVVMLQQILEWFLACGGKEDGTWATQGYEQICLYRAMRHAVPDLLNTRLDSLRRSLPELTKTASDCAAEPSAFAEYCAMYRSDIQQSGLAGYVFGHILENHLHVNLLPKCAAQREKAEALLQFWAQKTLQDGGTAAAENGVGKRKTVFTAVPITFSNILEQWMRY